MVIEGPAGPVRLDYYPPQVRKAIEVLTTYLDGFDAGLAAGGHGDSPRAQPDLGETARLAAAAGNAGFGAAFTSFSACGPVFAAGETPSSGRDILLLWGPDAADRVSRALTHPPDGR
ncbi:hypothetical protein Q0Z83_023140 [Actinoplanes sichuanensis]|nr:hypothetical protein Q0Z83_023140 [Actinoplanes sichuanensis]